MIWRKANNPNESEQALAKNRRLQELMEQTRPGDLDAETWEKVLTRIEVRLRVPNASPPKKKVAWLLSAALATATAAAVCLTIGLRVAAPPAAVPTTAQALEPFPVATSAEIEILSVGGADTHTLVVGQPPVDGMLELLEPGEVTLFSDAPGLDETVEIRFQGPHLPMIWANLD